MSESSRGGSLGSHDSNFGSSDGINIVPARHRSWRLDTVVSQPSPEARQNAERLTLKEALLGPYWAWSLHVEYVDVCTSSYVSIGKQCDVNVYTLMAAGPLRTDPCRQWLANVTRRQSFTPSLGIAVHRPPSTVHRPPSTVLPDDSPL